MASAPPKMLTVRPLDFRGSWLVDDRRYFENAHALLAELEQVAAEVNKQWPKPLTETVKEGETTKTHWKLGRRRDLLSDSVKVFSAMSVEAFLNYYGVLRLGETQYDAKFERHGLTVPPDAWAPFYEKLAEASSFLQHHKTVASADPHWYVEMVRIAIGEGWPLDKLIELVHEGAEREPYYYQIYFAATAYLLPIWHGNVEKLEAFAQAAAARTRREEGMGLYARIYWSVSQTYFGDKLFSEALVNWKTMKAGMRDVLQRFPDEWNIQHFASFACIANDKDETRRLVALMQGPPIAQAWVFLENYETCVAWTRRPGP